MSDLTPAYPQPHETHANRALIEGWKRGELHLQQCGSCGRTIFFPREFCPYCWSTDVPATRRSGRGTIVAHALVHSHVTQPFAGESPVVLAEIELEGGGAMLARLVTTDPAAAAPGLAVELVPMPEAARYPLPTFRLPSRR
jgi:uncharacterized OB-fold protein